MGVETGDVDACVLCRFLGEWGTVSAKVLRGVCMCVCVCGMHEDRQGDQGAGEEWERAMEGVRSGQILDG